MVKMIRKIRILECVYCGAQTFTNDLFVGTENFYYKCPECYRIFATRCSEIINAKDLVIWIENHKVIAWKPSRTPALGWNTLTLLEALTDSAKTLLTIKNYEKCHDRLGKMLKILRERIKYAKKIWRPLIQRCEFRETKRTRCNRTPVVGVKQGLNLCQYHFQKIKKQKTTIEAFI